MILDIRSDVLKALEITRKTKNINHSLESRIIIWCKIENLYSELLKIKDELRSVFICSDLIINNYEENENNDNFDYNGDFAAVVVQKLETKKCSRCWKYKENTDTDSNYPNICKECIDIIKQYYK